MLQKRTNLAVFEKLKISEDFDIDAVEKKKKKVSKSPQRAKKIAGPPGVEIIGKYGTERDHTTSMPMLSQNLNDLSSLRVKEFSELNLHGRKASELREVMKSQAFLN